jgi:enamine deaminase RidA (YjgF/YER057c/UK114 family)
VRREYLMVEVTKMTSPEYLIEMSAIAVIPD